MPFKLTEAHLHSLFQAANFDISNEMNFVGLRGCVPVEQGGTGFAGQHDIEYVGVDYMHLRCTFVQWMPGAGFADTAVRAGRATLERQRKRVAGGIHSRARHHRRTHRIPI